jgi:hypothetical protein
LRAALAVISTLPEKPDMEWLYKMMPWLKWSTKQYDFLEQTLTLPSTTWLPTYSTFFEFVVCNNVVNARPGSTNSPDFHNHISWRASVSSLYYDENVELASRFFNTAALNYVCLSCSGLNPANWVPGQPTICWFKELSLIIAPRIVVTASGSLMSSRNRTCHSWERDRSFLGSLP